MLRRFCLGLLFIAVACGGNSDSARTSDDPAIGAPAPAANGGGGPKPGPTSGGPAPLDFDPFAACPSVAPNAGAFDVVGDGVGSSAEGVVSLSRRGAGRATFLVRGSPFASLDGTPAAPYDGDYVVTARVSGAALVARAADDGTGYAVRAGDGKVELFAIGGAEKTLAGADATLGDGDVILRLRARDVDGKLELSGKAWSPTAPEPSAWAVTWHADAPGARPGRIGVTIGPSDGADAKVAYVHVDYASSAGLATKDLRPLASCALGFPSAPLAADGSHEPTADATNAAEAAKLLRWGLGERDTRVVAVSAGTNNDMDADGASPGCDTLKDAWAKTHSGDRCVASRYEALDIAWSALHVAGVADAENADPERTQWVIWGFGDTTKDVRLWYHPTGAADPSMAIPIYGLGGANAAIHGPDGAPKNGVVPLVSTFAYTYQHANDDASRFRDALADFAARGMAKGKDHLFVVSHSYGAAYTTTMLMKDELYEYHLDFALTAALPKVAADFDSLLPCAANILTAGLEGCLGGANALAAKLDLAQGIAIGPGGVVVYRVDRPDDPVANAKDLKTSFLALNAVVGTGTLSGHDYVTYTPSRTTSDCTLDGTNVKYPSGGAAPYAGVFGVDAFALECTVGGAVLDARCDGVSKQNDTWCKTLGGELFCAARPTGCQ